MDNIQIRLSHGLVEKIDQLVETGVYAHRSDVIRDAVRRFVLDALIGVIASKKDSVQEIRVLRKKMSSQKFDLEEINKLVD